MRTSHSRQLITLLLSCLMALASCGGGSPAPSPPPAPPPPVPGLALTRVSLASPFAANCNGAAQSGTLYPNAEVEPYVAINPADPSNLVGVWQQDRWSNGSAQGLGLARSVDGGRTWTVQTPLPFSRCSGAVPGSAGDYQRVSDPWVSFAADGSVQQISLSSTGGSFQPGSVNAILASRSGDGGQTWSAPQALIVDGPGFFNDKESITADRNDAALVYAVWDRLVASGGGATEFARSTDGGRSWEAARAIYDPGTQSQTIGNQLVVLPDGTLLVAFTQIDSGANNSFTAFYAVIRSSDRGLSWSAPIRISDAMTLGARDPETGAAIRDGSVIAEIAAGAVGQLALTWQDGRFSNGQVDAIALSRSSDGGLSWSAPVRINGAPDVPAFTPSIIIAADGSYAVSYYDFRENTSDNRTLLTSYWLTTSTDGSNWTERKIDGPFDIGLAPNADGFFLGDYQSLVQAGGDLLLFFVRTNTDTANRTDVYSVRTPLVAPAAMTTVATQAPPLAAGFAPSPAMRAQVSKLLEETVREERRPPRALRRRAVRRR